MATVCLLTTGQPSTNPRLVKEADALAEAGYDVHVICAHWVNWADEMDLLMLPSRAWSSCNYVGGHSQTERAAYQLTRIRYGLSRRSLRVWGGNSLLRKWALSRVLPELERAAKEIRADLYIAHYLGALPAALAAAKKHHARVGFDAEDFYSGMRPAGTPPSAEDEIVEEFERRYLPECDYLTAASPAIADAYSAKYNVPPPASILNVFPLAQRPAAFRVSVEDEPLTLYWFSQTIGADRGLEDIVRAMGLLRGRNVELHLRGDWRLGYQVELMRLAASVGVEQEQIIAHPPASSDEMVRLAVAYDIGLALEPHVTENSQICIANKIFTYLLAGNAVIATDTRGQRPVVEAIGKAGFYYWPGDARALANRLIEWYEDRASLNKARREAWDWGTREYNWDLEKRKFLQVIETVLNNHNGGGKPPLASL